MAEFVLRTAAMTDLPALAAVEAECFPPEEACTEEAFRRRLAVYADHFLLLLDGGRVIAFVDGFVTDTPDLTDEMYDRAELHQPAGAWQMIFGVNTLPQYRRRGCAGKLLRAMIALAEQEGRKGLVLTCKEALIPYYAGFGFVNEGVSQSVHGGVTWYQMRLTF